MELANLPTRTGGPLSISMHHFRDFQTSANRIRSILAGIAPLWEMREPATIIAGPHIQRDEATELLSGQPVGTAIVRFSMGIPGQLALSFKVRPAPCALRLLAHVSSPCPSRCFLCPVSLFWQVAAQQEADPEATALHHPLLSPFVSIFAGGGAAGRRPRGRRPREHQPQ